MNLNWDRGGVGSSEEELAGLTFYGPQKVSIPMGERKKGIGHENK